MDYILKKTAALLFLFAIAGTLCAQKYKRYHTFSHSSPRTEVNDNECLGFFYDTTGKSHASFKSVTKLYYTALDSLFHTRYIDYKETYNYNTAGKQIMNVTVYNSEIKADSTLTVYDNNLRKEIVTWCRRSYDSSGKMHKQSDEVFTYD